MKVVSRDPVDGMTIRNPLRLPKIITNSKRGFASGVLTENALYASTIPLTSHHEIAAHGEFELEDIDWDDPVPGKGHIRLQMSEETVEAEFWYDEEVYEKAKCPLRKAKLAAVADWMETHPGIRGAYAGAPPKIQIVLLHEGIRMWVFKEGKIWKTRDTPEPAPAPELVPAP